MKEYTDAEGLMALPTSDLHNPNVCLGAIRRRSSKHITDQTRPSLCGSANLSKQFNSITLPIETPLRGNPAFASTSTANDHTHQQHQSNNLANNHNISADLASVDSSDTYASCQTHPFLSQGDLTGEIADISHTLDEMDMNDLYFSSLERGRPSIASVLPEVSFKCGQVKKSASGEASLHSLAAAPMEEVMKNFQSFEMAARIDRGSHASLNDQQLPKHRKTRFQQGSLNQSKPIRSDSMPPKKLSRDSLTEQQISPQHSTSSGSKKSRRSSFMPTKSFASATKLINQHLFGIQNTKS